MNHTLQEGLFNAFYYVLRKHQFQLQELKDRGFNSQKFRTESASDFEVDQAYHFISLATFALYQQMEIALKEEFDRYFELLRNIALGFAGAVAIIGCSWIWFHLLMVERVSYVNAFLLLIPFEILSKNPYIKLYIMQEFDFKEMGYT